MNIQLLASEGEEGQEDQGAEEEEQQQEEGQQEEQQEDKPNEKMFTQEELDKIIAKKFKKLKEKEQQEKEEAEKRAKMTAEQLIEEDRKKLEAERKEFEHMKRVNETSKTLASKGLPITFADFLVGTDQEETEGRIEVFTKAFNDAVAAAVVEKFKKEPPKGSSTNADGVITRAQFKKMSLIKQAELARENPSLYEELTR